MPSLKFAKTGHNSEAEAEAEAGAAFASITTSRDLDCSSLAPKLSMELLDAYEELKYGRPLFCSILSRNWIRSSIDSAIEL